jgi:glycosyltransferase involved in cell wall biosynthesis
LNSAGQSTFATRTLAAPEARAPLRVAFLSYRSDPHVGGQGVYLSHAAHALARRGHRVDVISGPPYPELNDTVRLLKLPSLDLYAQPHNGHRALRWRHLASWTDTAEYFGHLSGKFMEPWSFGRRAARYLRTHHGDYDVVLDNQSLSSGLLTVQKLGLPLVGVIHHPIRRDLELSLESEADKGKRWLARRWYGFLTMQEAVAPQLRDVIVVSQSARQDIADCLRVPLERMTAIPLGVDLGAFRPQPLIARSQRRILTTSSADVPLKGLTFLIAAYAQLLADYPDLELVVIGKLREGPTADLLDKLGLRRRVQFLHGLTNAQMAAEYARATICVTPSLYEGFGLPAAEAMSCGAPVVVTDGGALPEVVGDAGVVVPKGNSEALAAAIGELLDDPARRRRLGAQAERRARDRYCWDRTAEAYEHVMHRAVGRTC